MNLRWEIGAWLAGVMAVVGCSSNSAYRTHYPPYDAGRSDHSRDVIESTDLYKLGIVEFDDQGYFWDTRQIDAVEGMIRQEAGLPAARHSATRAATQAVAQPIVLVTFVHGWKDNASYNDTGLVAFRQILTELARAEPSDHPRKVVGVYAAWRGLSNTIEPAKELSFWERKNVAHRVGGYGAMTRLLVDMENLQKQSLDELPADAPRTELIIIGHSFGGAAVYSALAQIITERFINTVEKGRRLKPLGDQVILLNPAFEALRHYDLNQMATTIDAYPPDQRPVLSIFTSKGDWATHYVFPIGRFLGTVFESNRDPEQKAASFQTVGWYRPFITHELVPREGAGATTEPATQTSTYNPASRRHELHSAAEIRESTQNVQSQRGKWRPNNHKPLPYFFDDTVLRPETTFRPGDPFLIVSVDKQIMSGHNDIANPTLINFLREYIQFSRIDPGDHSK